MVSLAAAIYRYFYFISLSGCLTRLLLLYGIRPSLLSSDSPWASRPQDQKSVPSPIAPGVTCFLFSTSD